MHTKHTPGPWRRNGQQIEGPQMALVIATATIPRIGWAPRTHEEAAANARLIAAAPDMLAALKAIAACENKTKADCIGLLKYARHIAKATITKVEGAQ